MDEAFSKELESDGWRIGTVQEFLGLTDEETAYIEIHLELQMALQARRAELGLNLKRFARRMVASGFSAPRRRKRRSPGLCVDTLIRGLLATGAKPQDIAAIIACADPSRPPECSLTWLQEDSPPD